MTTRIESLTAGKKVSEQRVKTIARAIELGADDATVLTLVDACRVKQNSATICIPADKLEGLSRGRGWCRQGNGDAVVWGERTDLGYRVGPGRWTIGATDGFSRKNSTQWDVRHVQVGGETWTIAD